MKLIDFHTHFFPDSIGPRTIEHILASSMEPIPSYGNGTLAALKDYMRQDGVDISVNMPVATKKEQVIGINRRMIECNKTEKNIICFGAMHQDFGEIGSIEEELEHLAKNGIRGIKLHPEYQQFFPDEPRHKKMYDACIKNNLMILFHAGVDMAYPGVHSSPERMAQVAQIKGLKMIFAHLGGYKMWDGVQKYLVGRDIYMDIAYTIEMKDELIKDMILAHGPEKILFGSDFPWMRAVDITKKYDNLFDVKTRDMIYYKNAMGLLGI